jgi:hypothetical protein
MGAGYQRWWRTRRHERACIDWRAQQFDRLDRVIITCSSKHLQTLRPLVELLRQIGIPS